MKKNLLAITVFFGSLFGLQAQQGQLSLEDLKDRGAKGLETEQYTRSASALFAKQSALII